MNWLRVISCCAFAGLVSAGAESYAISCTTQAEMTGSDRASLVTAARAMAAMVEAGDPAKVKAATVPTVADNFAGISGSIQALTPLLAGATLDVTSVYDLQAMDAKSNQDEIVFFCGEAANAPHVTFTIPQLPPGHYAFAIVQATGVKQPQRLSFLLQDAGSWQLAGFFPRPLLSAGQDGIWYWQKARAYSKAGQLLDAYFYYQTAAYLLLPADFVGSSNFEKLIQEQTASTPPGLPGAQPMTINAGDAAVEITNLHTDSSFGALDLVVNYNTADVSDPAAARIKTVALMRALLALHPELKDGFHGLWVFAHAPGQPPFALELPMAEIAAKAT